MNLLFLGFRNVRRNKRRSVLNIIALTMGIYLMTVGMGWVGGYKTHIFGAFMDLEAGEAQVINSNYLDEARRFPLDMNIRDSNVLMRRIKALSFVKEATERINFSVKLSDGDHVVPMIGKGIDPKGEREITVIGENIVDGSYLDSRGGVLIGKSMGDKLGLSVGDTIYLSAIDRYNGPNIIDLKIRGFFFMGYPLLDENLIYVDLDSARDLLTLDNEATRIVIRFFDGISPEKGLALLENERFITDQNVKPYLWKRFVQEGVKGVEADAGGLWVTLAIMYLLIILGILNSLSMTVHERIGEIGTVRAVGMKRSQLLHLFLSESLALALIAFFISLLFSLPTAWFLQFRGFSFGEYLPDDLPIPIGENFRADFNLSHFITPLILTLVTALVGGFIPARKAAHYSISESMGVKQIR